VHLLKETFFIAEEKYNPREREYLLYMVEWNALVLLSLEPFPRNSLRRLIMIELALLVF